MLVYLRDGPAQTSLHAATLRQELQIKLSLIQSKYTETRQTSLSADPVTPGRVATRVPFFKVTGMTRPGKSQQKKEGLNPMSVFSRWTPQPLGQ